MSGRGDFTRAGLERAGFCGWVPFRQMRDEDHVPRAGGVYVVSRATSGRPGFLDVSCGGWFKGKDPAVPEEALRANWVDGAQVVYIGKADELRRRLRRYADFGVGKPVGHWGGRLIWQLAEREALLVAWTETPRRVPREVEIDLIERFRLASGSCPSPMTRSCSAGRPNACCARAAQPAGRSGWCLTME